MPSLGTNQERTPPKRDPKTGRFLPGNKSGGRTGMPNDLREIIRSLCPEAVDVLADIMRRGKRDQDRIRAAEIILERGYGKPVQAVDLQSGEDSAVGVILIPSVTDAEEGAK